MTQLLTLLNQSPYDFYFLALEPTLAISLPQLKNFFLISAPKHLKNSGQLLEQSIDFISKNSAKSNHTPVIIPFKPSAKIDLICQKHHWLKVSNPAKINRLLEDKIKFVELCQQSHLPITPSIITRLSRKTFQKNTVIQTHFGWAGNSTHQFDSYTQAIKTIPENSVVKITPFLSGYSLLNNCCFTHHGLIQSPPAIQYTGLTPFTTNPFATVGRQWPSFAPKSIITQINQITESFAKKVLHPLHYLGFFGLDFLIHQDQIYLLECNPRLTASYAFYTQLELKTSYTPLFFLHLAEFLHLDYPLDLNFEISRFTSSEIIGSQLTPKNHLGQTITKIETDYPLFTP